MANRKTYDIELSRDLHPCASVTNAKSIDFEENKSFFFFKIRTHDIDTILEYHEYDAQFSFTIGGKLVCQ